MPDIAAGADDVVPDDVAADVAPDDVAADVAPDDVAADVALAGLPDDEVELVPEEGGSEAEVVDSTPPAEETEAP